MPEPRRQEPPRKTAGVRLPIKPNGRPASSAIGKPNVLDRIMDLGDTEEPPIRLALYGESGTGKTTLWGDEKHGFPGRTLAIICSGGKNSGELKSIRTPGNLKRIKTVQIEHSTEIYDLVDDANIESYDNVVLDHTTGLADMTLAEILGIDGPIDAKGWGFASRDQYGQSINQCKELLRKILGLPCNIILVAHQRAFKDEGDGELLTPHIGVDVYPKLANWVNGAVDYICQTFKREKEIIKEVKFKKGGKVLVKRVREKVKGETEYCLRIGPNPVYHTKFRSPMDGRPPLPESIVDPTYEKLMRYMKNADS